MDNKPGPSQELQGYASSNTYENLRFKIIVKIVEKLLMQFNFK